MSLHSYFRINQPDVIHENIDNEVVIVNLDSGNYYSLENISADIWDLINSETSLDHIVRTISQRYSGDQKSISDGINHFISQLLEEKLVAHKEPLEFVMKTASNPNVESDEGIRRIPYTTPTLNKYSDMQDLLLLDPIHDTKANLGKAGDKESE